MSDIGSIASLATYASQPFQVGRATPSGDVAGAGDADGSAETGSSASGATFSSDYAMSLLAKITHASADQALALIQGLSTPPPR
jgi:hypothetical protein